MRTIDGLDGRGRTFHRLRHGHGGEQRTGADPLRPLDSEREDRELRDRFVRLAARYRVPRTIALCTEWQPDVLVSDETDFGVLVAAERLGLPYATVLVIAAGSFVRTEVVDEALDDLRAEHGLPPDPDLEMLSRYLVLSPFPRSYRDPAHPLPATAHTFRPSMLGLAEDPAPAWSSVLPGTPTVYFTLGTIFNVESGDLLARVLTGLRELPINLIVTVGPHIDPAEFGPQPVKCPSRAVCSTVIGAARELGVHLESPPRAAPYRGQAVKPQVTRAFKRAGISVPRPGCHALRKTWATRAGELGDYEALREMGGWSSWQAMKHYAAASEERRRQIAERF